VADDVARLVGAALGGVVLGWAGLGGVVLADAVSFLAVVALLATPFRAAAARPDASRPHPGPLRAWLEGVRVVGTSRAVGATIAVASLLAVGQGLILVLSVVFVLQALGGSPADVGLLRAAVAVGTLAGGLVLAAVGTGTSPRRLSVLSLVGIAGFWAAVAAMPAITTAMWVYLVLFALGGLPGVGAFIGLQSLVQSGAPREALGRVFGLLGVCMTTAQGVGMLLAGGLGEAVGSRVLLGFAAGTYLGSALLGLALLPAPVPADAATPAPDPAAPPPTVAPPPAAATATAPTPAAE
jgi:hypothetical protein